MEDEAIETKRDPTDASDVGITADRVSRDARQRSRRRATASFLLFAGLALVLVAVYLVRRDGQEEPRLIAPTARPGHNQMADVVAALRTEGLTVSYGRRGVTSPVLSRPGQPLTVDGAPLYVFVYETAAARERETKQVDPASILPAGAAGTPGATGAGPPHLAQHSNVLVVLAGGSDELAAKVDAAIAKLV